MRSQRSHDHNEHHGHGGGTPAQASNLFFFGDSLTDNGNLFTLTQGGIPAAPWWAGRFSNGPTYAEQLPSLLGVPADHVQNFAFGGARAVTGNPIPIDLDVQVATFLAGLHGKPAPKGSEAVLYMGNNDYLNYTPTADNPPEKEIAAVIGKIQSAILTLQGAGVEKFVVFTLPHFSVTPAGQFLATHGGAAQVAHADAIIDANNAALKQLVAADNAAGLKVKIVDANVFGDAVAADGHAFGFKDLSIPIFTGDANTPTGSSAVFAPNEIAVTNDIHPTYAAHGAQAAFAAATLNADNVELYKAGGAVSYGTCGTNALYGGRGDDILIANRAGDNVMVGGSGDNLFILKEDAGAGFGHQTIVGGHGESVLRFIINDQNAASKAGLITEFQTVAAAFKASLLTNHAGTFTVDGLDLHGITGVQLQIDGVSSNPATRI